MMDRDLKGRLARGERSGNAKLTESIVRQIRGRAADGEMYASIAKDLNADPSHVRKIALKRCWKHVN